MWWEDFNCSVARKLVGRQDTCQLLGRNARQGMRTVSYLDNNHLNKPQTGGAPVYAAEELGLLTMQEITKTFSTVFEGVCWLSACANHMTRSHQYSMCPDNSKYPFEICCSAHSLSRELLPQWRSLHPGSAPWLPSSRKMAHFGCLDPTDLNQAIQQEHYPLSTIEDVATLLHEAKIFTILDVCKAY